MVKTHVCGVVKSRRSGGMLVDDVEIELPNTSHLGEWLEFSGMFASRRGYNYMAGWTFWDHLEDNVMEVPFAHQQRHCVMTTSSGVAFLM
jgi:hypothetical protein